MSIKKCKIKNCNNPYFCKSYCQAHYQLEYRINHNGPKKLKVPKPMTKLKLKNLRKQLDVSMCSRDRTREIVRIRDKHTCQMCGKIWVIGTRRFDVHHLNGFCGKKSLAYDRVKDIDGLITLCHKCHYKHPHFSQNDSFPQANV